MSFQVKIQEIAEREKRQKDDLDQLKAAHYSALAEVERAVNIMKTNSMEVFTLCDRL